MLKTKLRLEFEDDHVSFRFDIEPRGSGNRPYAEALARSFTEVDELRPHMLSCKVLSSSVTLEFKRSVASADVLAFWKRHTLALAG